MLDADCTDKEYSDKYNKIEDYQDKQKTSKFQAEKLLAKVGQNDSDTASSHHSDDNIPRQPSHERKYKLSKIETKKFEGNLKEWLSFWSQFEKIYVDKALHASDKFQ